MDDGDLRAVVLTGKGEKAFIGGADISEMADLTPETAETFITGLHGASAALRRLGDAWHAICWRRVLYYGLVIWTLAFVLAGVFMDNKAGDPCCTAPSFLDTTLSCCITDSQRRIPFLPGLIWAQEAVFFDQPLVIV
jgi:hypothetical protein